MTTADEIAKALVEGLKAQPSINMPDHPIRQARWYQLYVRLARPTLDWSGVVSASYAGFLGHWIGRPMDETYALVVFAFAASLFSLRTIEKIKGVA